MVMMAVMVATVVVAAVLQDAVVAVRSRIVADVMIVAVAVAVFIAGVSIFSCHGPRATTARNARSAKSSRICSSLTGAVDNDLLAIPRVKLDGVVA